jgi:hypothetical protein
MQPGGVTLKVQYGDPKESPSPLYSNHVGISRVGTEVQFEFVFVDINKIALRLQDGPSSDDSGAVEVQGNTVAKLILPLHVFIQMESHLQMMFESLRNEIPTLQNLNKSRETSQ